MACPLSVVVALALSTAACAGASAPSGHLAHPTARQHDDYLATHLPTCPFASVSKHFAARDEPCTDFDPTPVRLDYPPVTATGMRTVDAVQAVLAQAWAGHPDSVDLWVRTGCHGARELKHLLASVELFWSRGVGKVVLVLDDSDRAFATQFVPNGTRHAYDVRHERVPCMLSRVFNQVSYLMADHYSTADVIVTIDSDCVLHSPVTPRLLFRDGRIRLPHSLAMQPGMWDAMVEQFVGVGTFKFHTMVSQPVTFHRSTLAAYRDWYRNTRGACYLDGVARALDTVNSTAIMSFCWMCQLGTFINTTGITADLYDLVDVDARTAHPYQRLAVHVPYELAPGADFDASSAMAVRQGLCLALGKGVLPECAGASTDYVLGRMFTYNTLAWKASPSAKARTVNAYRREVAARPWLGGRGGRPATASRSTHAAVNAGRRSRRGSALFLI